MKKNFIENNFKISPMIIISIIKIMKKVIKLIVIKKIITVETYTQIIMKKKNNINLNNNKKSNGYSNDNQYEKRDCGTDFKKYYNKKSKEKKVKIFYKEMSIKKMKILIKILKI